MHKEFIGQILFREAELDQAKFRSDAQHGHWV